MKRAYLKPLTRQGCPSKNKARRIFVKCRTYHGNIICFVSQGESTTLACLWWAEMLLLTTLCILCWKVLILTLNVLFLTMFLTYFKAKFCFHFIIKNTLHFIYCLIYILHFHYYMYLIENSKRKCNIHFDDFLYLGRAWSPS